MAEREKRLAEEEAQLKEREDNLAQREEDLKQKALEVTEREETVRKREATLEEMKEQEAVQQTPQNGDSDLAERLRPLFGKLDEIFDKVLGSS